jgi:hypothetical protein
LDNTEKIKYAWSSIKVTCKSLAEIDEENKNCMIREILQALKIPIPNFVILFILNLANNRNLEKIIDIANKKISILDNKIHNL